MSQRDDFPTRVKQKLAERAGFVCSFPGCDRVTIGPSDEHSLATSNTGVACHIAGASSGLGSRRYEPTMTPEQRMSIDNGIWMCYTHSKLIDTDEVRFHPHLLKHWRDVAERKARLVQEHGKSILTQSESFEDLGLASSSLQIPSLGRENEAIGDLIRVSCMPTIWGEKLSDAIRDFIIELVRNAFTHGHATRFHVEISTECVQVSDDGSNFDTTLLATMEAKSGGALAAIELVTTFASRVLVSHSRLDYQNIVRIKLIHYAAEISSATRCAFTFSRENYFEDISNLTIHDFCNIVYIIFPPYLSGSDVFNIGFTLAEKVEKINKRIICVLTDASDSVARELKFFLPRAHIVNFRR